MSVALALVVLFEVLNVGDFVTTWVGLRLGATESNQIVVRWPVAAHLGKLAAMIAVLVIYAQFRVAMLRFHGILLVPLALSTADMAWTVVNNIRVCRAARAAKP